MKIMIMRTKTLSSSLIILLLTYTLNLDYHGIIYAFSPTTSSNWYKTSSSSNRKSCVSSSSSLKYNNNFVPLFANTANKKDITTTTTTASASSRITDNEKIKDDNKAKGNNEKGKKKGKNTTTTPVGKVLQQTVILDGGEWISVREYILQQNNNNNNKNPPIYARSTRGILQAITGSVNGKRIVALKQQQPNNNNDKDNTNTVVLDQDNNIQLDVESIAYIPDKVTEQSAIWTMLQAVSIHCALPQVSSNVGGENITTTMQIQNGTVIVMGSNEYAIQTASVLSKLNCNTILVSAKKPNNLPNSIQHITISNNNGDSFTTTVKQFDSMVDTLGDENDDSPGRGGVIKLLSDQHGCQTYISTMSESQKIVIKNGLLWGPGKTKEHANKIQQKMERFISPAPNGLGTTVQTMLEKGIILNQPKDSNTNGVYVRGWSLKDFWEYTTWPRDSETNIRFGLPVADKYEYGLDGRSFSKYVNKKDEDEEEEEDGKMISAPPMAKDAIPTPIPGQDDGEELELLAAAGGNYVTVINSVSGLQQIISNQQTCVVFLSAPFCRTCRRLKPQYQRMARKYNQEQIISKTNNDFTFIKAEAPGPKGKLLGKALGVSAVPSFILFKKGRRYGKVLSITRLPSNKLEKAIEYMIQGLPFQDITNLSDDIYEDDE